MENSCWLIQLLSLACTIKEYEDLPGEKNMNAWGRGPSFATCHWNVMFSLMKKKIYIYLTQTDRLTLKE